MKKILILLLALTISFSYSQDDKQVKKESIEDIIKPYLEKTLNTVDKGLTKGTELVVKEAPIIVKQYLMYEAITYGFWICIGILFIMIGKKLARNLTTDDKDSLNIPKLMNNGKYLSDSYNSNAMFAYYLSKTLGYLSGSILILFNILPFIKIIFLPKLYLIEKFINLL